MLLLYCKQSLVLQNGRKNITEQDGGIEKFHSSWCNLVFASNERQQRPLGAPEGKEAPASERPWLHMWLGLMLLTRSFFFLGEHSFTGSKGAVLEDKAGFRWKKITAGKGFLQRWRFKVKFLAKGRKQTHKTPSLWDPGSSAREGHSLEEELQLSLPYL